MFVSNTPEQKLRNIILEIIYRLPQTEPLKEHAVDICKTLMHLLRVENEENAVVSVKIIIDLHRSFRHVLEDQVQPFLDIVQEIYQNMEQTVKDAFDAATTPAPAPVTVKIKRFWNRMDVDEYSIVNSFNSRDPTL